MTENEYHDICWIIDKKYMALIVDGDVRLCTSKLFHVEYFQKHPDFIYESSFKFETNCGSQFSVKYMTITELQDNGIVPDIIETELEELKRNWEEKCKIMQMADDIINKVKIKNTH